MKNFRHFTPPLRIHQGEGCLKSLVPELDRTGSKRAVLFCGTTISKSPGVIDLVCDALGDRLANVYPGARADTPLQYVKEAAAVMRELKVDAIVAVGGGSALTMARAVSILMAEKGDAHVLCTQRDSAGKLYSPKLLEPKLPIIAIPTTPTTATVKAGSAILDPIEGKRLALYDPKTRAQAVFLHPALIQSPPRRLVVSAALNSLALAIEGLMSHGGDPMSDAMLMHATRLLAKHLPGAASHDDVEDRAELMMASILCGHGSDYTGAGMAIPVGHAISTKFDIDVGITDSIMLPHVINFNAVAAKEGLQKIGVALRIHSLTEDSSPSGVIRALDKLYLSLGLPKRLRDVGILHSSLGELAAISFDDWYLQNNPRPISEVAQVRQVLEEAW